MGPDSAENGLEVPPSAVLVVMDVAVSMRRQVPVLPGAASDQSIDKVVGCVCGFFSCAPFRRKRVPIFQPSSTHSCECSRAPGVVLRQLDRTAVST